MERNKAMKNKKIIFGVILLFLSIGVVSAEFWSCFNKGDVVNYCNNYKPDKKCEDTNGCVWCMSVYREPENCYVHGAWPKCMQIPQECSSSGGGTIDSEAPTLNLISPLNEEVYASRSIPFEFTLNESADVYYQDLINGQGRWVSICSNCENYYGEKNLKEGTNNLTIKASDRNENTVYKNVSFFVDSQKPVISTVMPSNGFVGVNNLFEIKFREENPEKVIIYYGNQNKELNISGCNYERGKYYCDTNLDLTGFNNQEIEYYFYVEDIAGNAKESVKRSVDVDTSSPVLNNPGSFYEIKGRYVYFNMSVTEDNLDRISYSYLDGRGRLRETLLCSKLKNGFCAVKKSFSTGSYDLTLSISDKAGNNIGVPIHL